MEMMAMVSSLLSMQAGNTQGQIAATIMKQNLDAEKSAVLTLLGQPSQANLGPVSAAPSTSSPKSLPRPASPRP